MGSKITRRPSRWEAGEPAATRVSTAQRLPEGEAVAPQAGSAPRQRYRGQQEPQPPSGGARTDSIQTGGGGSWRQQALQPSLQVGMSRHQSFHHSGGWNRRGIRVRPPCSSTRSVASAGRAPAWLHPPGEPGAERLRGPETPVQPPPPCPSGLPTMGAAPRPWLQRGLRWAQSCQWDWSPRSWGGYTSRSGRCPADS